MNALHLLAMLLGVAVCLQGAANGVLGSRIGLPLALTINTVVVLAGCLAWLVIAPAGPRMTAPWLSYGGGLCGIAILTCAAIAFPRLGASATTVLAVASQLLTALALDRFGLTGEPIPLSGARIAGIAMVGAGAALVLGSGRS
jgi:bacterial/archaeal transporter family-2 protein